jgi:hypothetical protein
MSYNIHGHYSNLSGIKIFILVLLPNYFWTFQRRRFGADHDHALNAAKIHTKFAKIAVFVALSFKTVPGKSILILEMKTESFLFSGFTFFTAFLLIAH